MLCKRKSKWSEAKCLARAPSFATHNMKKIEAKSTVGNFLVDCTAEVTEEQFAYFASKGLLWSMQRQSEVDKVLGAFDAEGKRKDKWTRNSVDYSPDMASKLQAVYASLAMPDKLPSLPTTASVTEHVREQATPKYALAKAAMLRHESKDDLEEWLADTIGYDGATHGDDGEYAIPALQAIDAYIKAL